MHYTAHAFHVLISQEALMFTIAACINVFIYEVPKNWRLLATSTRPLFHSDRTAYIYRSTRIVEFSLLIFHYYENGEILNLFFVVCGKSRREQREFSRDADHRKKLAEWRKNRRTFQRELKTSSLDFSRLYYILLLYHHYGRRFRFTKRSKSNQCTRKITMSTRSPVRFWFGSEFPNINWLLLRRLIWYFFNLFRPSLTCINFVTTSSQRR